MTCSQNNAVQLYRLTPSASPQVNFLGRVAGPWERSQRSRDRKPALLHKGSERLRGSLCSYPDSSIATGSEFCKAKVRVETDVENWQPATLLHVGSLGANSSLLSTPCPVSGPAVGGRKRRQNTQIDDLVLAQDLHAGRPVPKDETEVLEHTRSNDSMSELLGCRRPRPECQHHVPGLSQPMQGKGSKGSSCRLFSVSFNR